MTEKPSGREFQTSVRVSPKVKERLREAAAASGRSLSAEMQVRLERSVMDDEREPLRNEPVIRALCTVLDQVQKFYGAKWHENHEVGDLCRRKMIDIVDLFLPTLANPKLQHFLPKFGQEVWEIGELQQGPQKPLSDNPSGLPKG